MNIDLSKRKKFTLEELEQLAIEIENNPDKYKQCWSKPWTEYTWAEILSLWNPPETSQPH
jgi:hypothetical protein